MLKNKKKYNLMTLIDGNGSAAKYIYNVFPRKYTLKLLISNFFNIQTKALLKFVDIR